MAVRIRLTRVGKIHRPYYQIGVYDSRTRRQGQYIEKIGHYDPKEPDPAKKISIEGDRYEYWTSQGAKPSEAVARLLEHTSVLTQGS